MGVKKKRGKALIWGKESQQKKNIPRQGEKGKVRPANMRKIALDCEKGVTEPTERELALHKKGKKFAWPLGREKRTGSLSERGKKIYGDQCKGEKRTENRQRLPGGRKGKKGGGGDMCSGGEGESDQPTCSALRKKKALLS